MQYTTNYFKIAIDVMGGDFAPVNEIEGVIKAFEVLGSKSNFEVVLIGKEGIITSHLNKYNLSNVRYSIINADEVITMKDDATSALKSKKNSSLYIGMELLRNKQVDAFLSAGNTGAMLSTATILLGRIKGVSRPTIGTFFPTMTGNPTLIVDVGANVDCKPRFLFEFAIMGAEYYKLMLGVEKPKIGLLNIGEEDSKGNEVSLLTNKMLKEVDVNFHGNIEGRDIFKGVVDVVVCDGFTGNIILKFAESFLSFFKHKVKSYADKSLINKLKVLSIKPTLKDIMKEFDYQEYGGVPLLGVNGIVMISHGSSSPKAIKNMIFRTIEVLEKDLNKNIEIALANK
jgi:glycerol-3-phosphate acyltransferase PlsX